MERVTYQKCGPVAYVTINRAKSLNALDLQTHEELCSIWDDFEKDTSLRVAVLTGSGEKSFSVGQDLKELKVRMARGEKASSFGSKGLPGYPRLTERTELSKPVIAKVNGFAYGGGFELALACDIIVAVESAVFALPEAKLGLIAGAGGVFRFFKQLPHKVAMGYLITGREMSARQAYDYGLINDVVRADNIDKCIEGWINDILRCSSLSISSIKEVAEKSASLTNQQAFETDFYWERKRIEGEDCVEGPLAFLEKRPPKWTQ